MTYFEAVGVDYQYSATNIFYAKRQMDKSCAKCSTQGKYISCDRCAIATAHDNVLNILKGREM